MWLWEVCGVVVLGGGWCEGGWWNGWKTVGLGEGKWREGEGVVVRGEKGEVVLRGRFSGLGLG